LFFIPTQDRATFHSGEPLWNFGELPAQTESMTLILSVQDFWQMVVHHVATLSLVVMSWTANMVRVGTLVLCVHDAVDYFLEVHTYVHAAIRQRWQS